MQTQAAPPPAAEQPGAGILLPAPGSKFLILYAAVVDDPKAPFDPAAHHEMFIQTSPLKLDGRYVIDKDCKVYVASETLKSGILRALYPRESA